MQLLRNLICLLLVFVSIHTQAQQTFTVSGTVTDEKGETLPGATVFITNTKHITSTDTAGKFSFNHISPGTYEVVARMIGFTVNVQSVIINNKSVILHTKLIVRNTTLNAVTIKSVDPNRERYLDMFIRSFIGETVNSQQCKLLNSDVLNFHYNKNTKILVANTDDFLIIENKALGYKIKYLLKEFEEDFRNNVCMFSGYPYFEEMKGTKSQQQKWERNRKLAYLSSDRHFFKSVMNGTTQAEGFYIYLFTDSTNTKKKVNFLQEIDTDSLFFRDMENSKTLIVKSLIVSTDTAKLNLCIFYTREAESALFSKTGKPVIFPPRFRPARQGQISELKPLTNKIRIDTNGNLIPDKSFIYAGYWAWQKIADLTPLEYFIDPSEEINKKQ